MEFGVLILACKYVRSFLRKVDDFVGVLVAYIYRPVNYVVGHVVLRPQAAIHGRSQDVYIVLLAVEVGMIIVSLYWWGCSQCSGAFSDAPLYIPSPFCSSVSSDDISVTFPSGVISTVITIY